MDIEKETCCFCNENAYHHFCHVDKENKQTMCFLCYNNNILNRASEYCGEDIDVMVKEINEKAYGGEHTFQTIDRF